MKQYDCDKKVKKIWQWNLKWESGEETTRKNKLKRKNFQEKLTERKEKLFQRELFINPIDPWKSLEISRAFKLTRNLRLRNMEIFKNSHPKQKKNWREFHLNDNPMNCFKRISREWKKERQAGMRAGTRGKISHTNFHCKLNKVLWKEIHF